MSADTANSKNQDFFSKDFEGVWYLLAIPTFSILGTIIVALIILLKRRLRRNKPIDAAHLHLDVAVRPSVTLQQNNKL
jgi:hypothetical protein